MKNKIKILIGIGVIIIGLIIINIPTKNITCYKTETEIERVPYTVCGGYSFWTGDCNSWKTKYMNKEKEIEVPYTKKVNWIYGEC